MFYLIPALDCPNDYELQDGDANGIEWAISGPSGMLYNPLSSIGDCGRLCDNTAGCKAIEWSPSALKCVLINTANANGPKYLDYYFCSKGNIRLKELLLA